MRGSSGLFVALCFGLSGCVTTGTTGSGSALANVFSRASALHSEVDARISLALSADREACSGPACSPHDLFGERVARIGEKLSWGAFALYPELRDRFGRFEFMVVEKQACGATSTASGQISVFRGIDQLGLDDAALALVLAREMAHVAAGHHDENMLTSVAMAIAAQIFMPVLTAVRGAASVAASSSMTTSAASFAGTQVLRAGLRPVQQREAEELGLELARAGGFVTNDGIAGLQVGLSKLAVDDGWVADLRESMARLEVMSAGASLASLNTHVVDELVSDVEADIAVAELNLLLSAHPTAAGPSKAR